MKTLTHRCRGSPPPLHRDQHCRSSIIGNASNVGDAPQYIAAITSNSRTSTAPEANLTCSTHFDCFVLRSLGDHR